ncbi:MAG: hypothetical protein ABF723_13925 [Lentilactobacillus hilgardii]|uniref:hypothetical protein n=1 Tax=Lentilactobacillus hilgardii TaxID=1588 RepID=UPI0039E87939
MRERAKRLSQSQLDEMPGTRLAQLNDKPQKDNKTGHKNISIDVRNGTTWYRVSVTFKRVRHQTRKRTLEEAIEAREALREKYWPNYKK